MIKDALGRTVNVRLKNKTQGWRGGPGGKVLALQEWGPQLGPLTCLPVILAPQSADGQKRHPVSTYGLCRHVHTWLCVLSIHPHQQVHVPHTYMVYTRLGEREEGTKISIDGNVHCVFDMQMCSSPSKLVYNKHNGNLEKLWQFSFADLNVLILKSVWRDDA